MIKPGESAALLTAVLWTFTALSFEAAARRAGSLAVNTIKMYLAFFFFAVFSWIFYQNPFPVGATSFNWTWLLISGFIGFALGDLVLMKALTVIGARISMLVMSLVPIMTAIMGYFLMDEVLSLRNLFGMALTLTGVSMVILTRESKDSNKLKYPLYGILLAFGGAVGQAVGLVLSKYGMEDYNAFSATQIRIIAGLVGFTLWLFFFRAWDRFKAALKNTSVMKFTFIGSVCGPFLGVYLSLVAVKYTETGVAATIMSIVPVLIIPFAILFFKEKVNLREIIGALIAVAGTAVMFL